MSVYLAAIAERELGRDDFCFLFSHDPAYEEKDIVGELRAITGKYGRLHFALFQMNDESILREPDHLTFVMAYSLEDTPHALFNKKHKKYTKEYRMVTRDLVGMFQPKDMSYSGHANGNFSNVFTGINRKALSDHFADQSRTTFKIL